ncbi:Uncharacterised protein [Vibrio cholerae]|nr:Uncharacterised protein [Vibrio cholerae]
MVFGAAAIPSTNRIVIIASLAKLCEFLRPILCQVKAKNVYSSCSAKSFIGS